MLLIHCPYCGEDRPELEFRHAGEAHIARPTNIVELNDQEFEAFFFIRSNPKGIVFERWRHIHGCARFFNAARDTVSDKFLTTYKAGEPKPDLDTRRRGPGTTPKRAQTAPAVKAAPGGKATAKSPARKPAAKRGAGRKGQG